MPTRTDRLAILMLETPRRIRDRLNEKRGETATCATYLQLATLRFVGETGLPTMKDVAAHLRIAPPSATGVIDGLVRSGLLRRRAQIGDRRTVRLRLTPKGRTALRTGMRLVSARMRVVLSVLTEKERSQLTAILERLFLAFEN
jgi:DNA-binding MarR family transcriptional regulator